MAPLPEPMPETARRSDHDAGHPTGSAAQNGYVGEVSDDLAEGLPIRSGPRPTTTPTNPHTQLDQQPTDRSPRRRLEAALSRLPDVRWGPSRISVPGAVALLLDPQVAAGPPAAFLVPGEFAHLHPDPDHSLHLALPTALAEEAVQGGWAEQHPVARRGLIPPGSVMVYAPRDDAEADVVAALVHASWEYARGPRQP